MPALIAALHLTALALAMYAVLARGTALRDAPTIASLRHVFRSDTMWGICAIVLLGSGLYRLLGGIEKGTLYYMKNPFFHAKLTLVVLIIALEIGPMITLLRARFALQRGADVESLIPTARARRIAMISHIQALLMVIIIFVACAMARGYGARG